MAVVGQAWTRLLLPGVGGRAATASRAAYVNRPSNNKYSTSASAVTAGGDSRIGSEAGPTGTYDELYRRSLENPEDFWAHVGECATWFTPFNKVLDNSNPPFSKWYVGGTLNTCYNAVDRHVEAGRGEQAAIIHDSPITNSLATMTYSELQEEAARMAGGLSKLGVTKGDRVLIYMPMIPQAIVAIMAITRLGAVHSLIFGGFAARELAVRINHLEPKVIISASCGVEPSRTVHYKPILDQAIDFSSHKPQNTLIFQRPGLEEATMKSPRDVDWQELRANSQRHDCVPVDSNDPCYVLYTSGTTGDPKGIVRPTGGHAAVLPWTMHSIYDMNPGEAWWAASDLGWIVGHSYICYAPLFNGNTTIVFEGKPVGTPDAGQFFRVIQDHNVKGMFTAPTAIRAIMKADPEAKEAAKYDTSCLRSLFLAGESLDNETRKWSENNFKVPILDNWWQTETGSAITAHCRGLGMNLNPPRNASGKAFMGYDLRLLREDGSEAENGELGRIVSKLPLPPSCMTTLYQADKRFVETYFSSFPGYYDSMDAGIRDNEGYVAIMAREDDVINVAGHRLSTLALEEAMLEHPCVIDAAVVGVPDELKGEVPLGLFVIKPTSSSTEEQIQKELISTVRQNVGPVAAFRLSAQVSGLPRTRSGKTARKSIADLARNKHIKISPTIEDPDVYVDILRALRSVGMALDAPDPINP